MKFLKPLERWMYGRYRRIVCVGDETRLSLTDHLKSPELSSRMITVPNGIDLGKFYAASPAVDLMKTEGYSITMVAAFRPQKDQQTLIRAIAMLPNRFRLFLAGGSETDADRIQLEDCRRLVNELGVADRVCFLGIRNDVPALFAASDLVAFSTHYEGMSLSVIEGMASGKPFVASDVSGVRDMVEGAGVLFPEGNAERLAAIISHLSEDPAAATETGKRCRQRAGMYDIRHTIRRYRDEYDSIVSNV
jgi:glycosyltransferase involved in cell wall biosynthesis